MVYYSFVDPPPPPDTDEGRFHISEPHWKLKRYFNVMLCVITRNDYLHNHHHHHHHQQQQQQQQQQEEQYLEYCFRSQHNGHIIIITTANDNINSNATANKTTTIIATSSANMVLNIQPSLVKFILCITHELWNTADKTPLGILFPTYVDTCYVSRKTQQS